MADTELAIVVDLRKRIKWEAPRVELVAVPNAAKRSQWAAMQAKREGMQAGFPDLVALAPGAKIAFLEMKTPKGRVSENQAEWLDRLHAMGFACGVFRSADAALDFLRDHDFPFMSRAS